LKHTRKHERREESNQGTKLPSSGGLSGQVGRTVRKGHADCPAGYRRLSAPLPRTVRLEPRTVRKRQQNLQGHTANNGPSAGSMRTVRQAPAVTEPLKLLPYYRLNCSSGSLSNNAEVTYHLCRVEPGKSLTSQDRHLYNKLTRRRVQR
jgi:hypothetical protein